MDLSFTLIAGRVLEATGSADLTIPIGSGANLLTITGHGSFEFFAGNFPSIDISGSAVAGGRTLTTVSASLAPGFLRFAAQLDVGGVFSAKPSIAGYVAWRSANGATMPNVEDANGNVVTAQQGDFLFEANNVGMAVQGFNLLANVRIGRTGGTVFGAIATRLDLGIDQFGLAAEIVGSFDGTGNVSLAGNGRATIGGALNAALAFRVVRQGGAFAVSANVTVTVPTVGAAAVAGSFSRDAQGRTLYELSGSIAFNPAGYNFGTATFAAYRRASGASTTTGMEAGLTVNIPQLATGTAQVFVYGNGYFTFTAYLATQGAFGDALNHPTARISYHHVVTDTFSFAVDLDRPMKIPASFNLSGTISRDGGYDVSAGVAVGPWHNSIDLGVCDASYTVAASLVVRVRGGGAQAFAVGMTADGTVRVECGVGIGVGFSASLDFRAPSSFSFRVSVNFDIGIDDWDVTVYSG